MIFVSNLHYVSYNQDNTTRRQIIMKRKLLVLFIIIVLCPLFLFAEDIDYNNGFHFYNSAGLVSTTTGIGYRSGRFEIGGNLSSSAAYMSVAMLLTNFRPVTGFILGLVAFGGVDFYARFDLIPNPKYELSMGMGLGATYCLFGAFDIGIITSLSIRSAININKNVMFFLESGVPIYSWEFSDSCSPDRGVDIYQGFSFPSLSFAALSEALMTTRIGTEILF